MTEAVRSTVEHVVTTKAGQATVSGGLGTLFANGWLSFLPEVLAIISGILAIPIAILTIIHLRQKVKYQAMLNEKEEREFKSDEEEEWLAKNAKQILNFGSFCQC